MASFKYGIECFTFMACACAVTMTTVRNQYIYQAVSEYHNYTANDSVQYCGVNDTSTSKEDEVVATDVSKLTIYIELASGLPSMFAALILTSWSDKVGRKIPLTWNIMCYIVSSIIQIFLIHFKMPLYMMIINSFILGIGGTVAGFLNISMTYVSDITRVEDRSTRYTLLESIMGLGGGLSSFGTGYWITAQGFIPTSCFASACGVIALLLIPWMPKIPIDSEFVTAEDEYTSDYGSLSTNPDPEVKIRDSESSKVSHDPTSTISSRLKSVWRVYTTECSICTICHEEGFAKVSLCGHGGGLRKGRVWRLWFYILSFNFYIYMLIGISAVETMYYLAYPLCFSPTLVGGRSGLKFSTLVLAPFLIKFYHSVLHLNNQTVVLLSVIAEVAFCLTTGFATVPFVVFIAASICTFSNLTMPVIRSQISSLVSTSEQGTALSLVSATESFGMMIGPITYLMIYPATLDIAHGFVWFYSALILVVPLFLMTMIWIVNKRKGDNTVLEVNEPLLN